MASPIAFAFSPRARALASPSRPAAPSRASSARADRNEADSGSGTSGSASETPTASASARCASQQNISRSPRRYTLRRTASMRYVPRPPRTDPAEPSGVAISRAPFARVPSSFASDRDPDRRDASTRFPQSGQPHFPAKHRSSHARMNSSPVNGATSRRSAASASAPSFSPPARATSASARGTGSSCRSRSTTASFARASSTSTRAIAVSAARLEVSEVAVDAPGRGSAILSRSVLPGAFPGTGGEGRVRGVGRFLAVFVDVALASPVGDAPLAPRAATDSPMAHCHCARDTRSSAPSGGTIAASRANAAP